MSSKAPHKILGISENASLKEAKIAYKNKAKYLHPDINKSDNAEEEFKILKEAYNKFEEKSKFDPMLGNINHFFDDINNLDNIKKENSSFKEVGHDIRFQITLLKEELEDDYTLKKIYAVDDFCENCFSTGYEIIDCYQCNGSGQIKGNKRSITYYDDCPSCNGVGKVKTTDKCMICDGTGIDHKIKESYLTIPKGTQDGEEIIYPELGGLGTKKRGNVVLYVNIIENNGDDLDIYDSIEIDFFQAILGDKISYRTPYKRTIDVNIPEGIQYGQKFRIKSQGHRDKNGNVGDLYLKVKIKTPKELSENQIRLLKKARKR